MKRAWLCVVAAMGAATVATSAGCEGRKPVFDCGRPGTNCGETQGATCVEDRCAIPSADCPSGLVWDVSAGELAGMCTPPGGIDGFSCPADTFLSCEGNATRVCNTAGDGVIDTDCGAPGCNATAGRCNACEPSSVTCQGTALARCDADGQKRPDETCTLGCNPGGGTAVAHCTYISPRYLPDVCDLKAAAPIFALDGASASIDTNLDSNCNGGIVPQSGGPTLCVMRYGEFRISAGRTLTVEGTRALAVVTDGKLDVLGVIDVAADNTVSGPGGGVLVNGVGSDSGKGGGGAGGSQAGAEGGTDTFDGGGGAGGAAESPLDLVPFVGGRRADSGQSFGAPDGGVGGGGGGGAVALISCRGTVTVSGTIDAGGGGGAGGLDQIPGGMLSFLAGGGGGAGGHIALEGAAITVTGSVYANGGGGGPANDISGGPGADGTRSSTTAAAGGTAQSGSGVGGTGGSRAGNPGRGKRTPAGSSGDPGGGGGGTGFAICYTPAGVAPTLAPVDTSPAFSTTRAVTTR